AWADGGVPIRGDKGASGHVRSVGGTIGAHGVEAGVLTTRQGPREGPGPAAPVSETRSDRACGGVVGRLARWMGGGEPLERAWFRLLDNFWIHAEARRIAQTWRPDLVYE